jgi:hypothetical protein
MYINILIGDIDHYLYGFWPMNNSDCNQTSLVVVYLVTRSISRHSPDLTEFKRIIISTYEISLLAAGK